MRDAGKTCIIVASARAILERCPPVLLHWWACEYWLKLKSVSLALVNRPQKLNTSRVLFWFLCSPKIFYIHLESVSAYALPLCPGPAVRKALHFPPPLPKKIFLMAHPPPLLHIGPVAARVCPKEYSFLKQDFSIKSKIFVRTKQALCSQQLWASNFLKRVQKFCFVFYFAYAQEWPTIYAFSQLTNV